jgi:hypothetical protein
MLHGLGQLNQAQARVHPSSASQWSKVGFGCFVNDKIVHLAAHRSHLEGLCCGGVTKNATRTAQIASKGLFKHDVRGKVRHFQQHR